MSMGEIVIRCPKTDKVISTEMAVSKKAFELGTYVNGTVKCPECGETHTWNKKDAWLREID